MATTHRERVLAALNHEEPDRVPIDFGASHETAINISAYRALLDHLGIEPDPEEREAWGNSWLEIAIPNEEVLRRFDADLRGVEVHVSAVDTVRSLDENTVTDGWGIVFRRSHPGAPYMIVESPLQRLDEPTPADVEILTWPEGDDIDDLPAVKKRLQRIRSETDFAASLRLRNVGAFGIAQRLRGFTELLQDLILSPEFGWALHERATAMGCALAEAALREVGDLVDTVSFADDLGVQTQTIMSPELYRAAVKPHHAKLVETIHRHTDARVVMHNCGAIRPLLPDLIDCGVDVINPVQTNADGMDPDRLKREFGDNLCFWGGIDTQDVLPHGSPSDVAEEVRRRISDLGRGGGYVLAAVHNIQPEVPPENIAAMYETAVAATR